MRATKLYVAHAPMRLRSIPCLSRTYVAAAFSYSSLALPPPSLSLSPSRSFSPRKESHRRTYSRRILRESLDQEFRGARFSLPNYIIPAERRYFFRRAGIRSLRVSGRRRDARSLFWFILRLFTGQRVDDDDDDDDSWSCALRTNYGNRPTCRYVVSSNARRSVCRASLNQRRTIAREKRRLREGRSVSLRPMRHISSLS